MKTLLTLIFLCASLSLSAQNGEFGGRSIDEETGEYIPFAKVWLAINGEIKYWTFTDFDGIFQFKNIPVGEYQLHIKFMGYKEIIENIRVHASETGRHDFNLDTDEIIWCELTYYPDIAVDKNREVGVPFGHATE